VLKSYLAMAVRQLLAQKPYTAINVAGLALGLACTLLIALFVRHELSYDRHYANSGRIVRISEDIAVVPPLHFAGASAGIAPLLRDFFPVIETTARLRSCFDGGGGSLVTVGERRFLEPRLAAADNEFFEIFDLAWLRGDARCALTPVGRLSRYFYGVEYSPKELRLALVESSEGRVGSAVEELLLY
jgi:putative ABC transport system permease protein